MGWAVTGSVGLAKGARVAHAIGGAVSPPIASETAFKNSPQGISPLSSGLASAIAPPRFGSTPGLFRLPAGIVIGRSGDTVEILSWIAVGTTVEVPGCV